MMYAENKSHYSNIEKLIENFDHKKIYFGGGEREITYRILGVTPLF